MESHGVIQNGGLCFPENILRLRNEYLTSIREGTKIVEIIKRDRSSKTQKQLNAIFGVYLPIIRQTMIDFGNCLFGCAPSKDMVKEILYQCCGGVGDHGESKTLSKMDIAEAGRFISNIQDFYATQFKPHHLPELNPNWKDLFDKPET